jgi:hypothetical protein
MDEGRQMLKIDRKFVRVFECVFLGYICCWYPVCPVSRVPGYLLICIANILEHLIHDND